jgi:hypothetical protein
VRGRKAPGSNHQVDGGGARTGEDRLGRQINPEASSRKLNYSQAAARYAVSDGRQHVGCVVESDGVYIAVNPAGVVVGTFARLALASRSFGRAR